MLSTEASRDGSSLEIAQTVSLFSDSGMNPRQSHQVIPANSALKKGGFVMREQDFWSNGYFCWP
jgi:hypothetical protein